MMWIACSLPNSSRILETVETVTGQTTSPKPWISSALPTAPSSALTDASSPPRSWEDAYRVPWELVWSKISNALKRLGSQSHNFLTQLLSETSRACTIRVRRSTLGRLWNELGSHAGLHHRHRRSRTAGEERISGCGEPYPESPGQGPTASFRS